MSRAVCGPVTEESAKSSCVPWSSHSTSRTRRPRPGRLILCSRRHWCRGCQPLLKTIPGLQRASMGPKGVFDADSPEDLPSIRTPYEPCKPVRSHQARCVRWSGSARGSHERLHAKRWSVRRDGGVVGSQQSRLGTAGQEVSHWDRLASPSYHLPCIGLTAALGGSYQLSETLPRRQPRKEFTGSWRASSSRPAVGSWAVEIFRIHVIVRRKSNPHIISPWP